MAADRQRSPLSVVPAGSKDDPSDADLARALIAGEDGASTAVWNRFAPLVYRIAHRALGRDSDAEDVTQEVFFRLFSRIGTLREPTAFRSFVVSFAIRIVKWELRRRRARHWLTFWEPERLPAALTFDGDPESRDVLRRFYTFLDQLGARDRLVFALRHMESMTLFEIAEALEISLSTAKRSLASASLRVSKWIDGDADLLAFFEKRRGGDGTA